MNLRWSGNVAAQRQADAAYKRLRPKRKRKSRRKRAHTFNRCAPTDELSREFRDISGNATELLGHSSRKITRAYLDPRIVRRTSAIDLLFRPGE